jgi:UDP-N-acetylmuramate--alanine ligase
LQGFLEMLEKPYAGPGFRGAAICMDKILTKKLVAFEGVPTPHFYAFGYWEWLHQKDKILSDVKQSLKLPVFVKPSHAGSSIGITKISEYVFLERAIEYAFRFDYQLLIEEGKEGCRELEFAVLGNSKGEIHVPPPGEKLSGGNFVDYEKKYGSNSVKTTLDAQLEKDLLEKGKTLALKAYEATGNSGMTRVDFLLDKEGNFWFFEMNPIPGLTPLSLYPKIWERQGMDGQKLVDRLIILGLQRNREQKRHLNPL